MKLHLLLYTAGLLAFAACSGSEETGQGGSQPLALSAAQQNMVSSVGDLTRAADGNYYTSTSGFDGTETVKVWFNNASSTYQVGRADNSQVSTLYGGDLTYPADLTGTAALWAVYPEASGEAGSHTVAADQNEVAAYKQSDLMFAASEVDFSEDRLQTVHNLLFDHQLVKLKVVVSKSEAITAVTQVRLLNVKRTVAFTCAANTGGDMTMTQTGVSSVDDDEANDNIVVFTGSQEDNDQHTYVALFPAQTWDRAPFLEVTADDCPVTYIISKSDWANGHEYTINIHVDKVLLDNYVTISDWRDDGTITLAGQDCLVIAPIADQAYNNGDPVTPDPEPVVTFNGVTLTKDTDYRLHYSNNTSVGTATVTVVGINYHIGQTATATFEIVAAAEPTPDPDANPEP